MRGAAQLVGTDLQTDEAIIEIGFQRSQVGLAGADGGPGGHRVAPLCDALAPGLQQRLGLTSREVLDTERGGERHAYPGAAGWFVG